MDSALPAGVFGFASRDAAAAVGGETVDEAAAAVEHAARTRWSTRERPEWIGLAARAFHGAGSPA
ncbi:MULTISPECIES: hypothetical protein [Streptomyces]|uniref:hypothetical protein n=1 Tax=Streptomyces TaxID=1883 RepID=UPI0019244DF2|nr:MULTISPECIES: hypothetical protein [Streptomyces]MCM9077309.1 hypothetical protein [Streptomyces spororaveus]MCX5309291.1 hypothetical protein [Streptomyces sp. NBC_00160]